MTYKLIEQTNFNDGTATSQATYSFTDIDEAIGTMRQKEGGARKTPKYESEALTLIDHTGKYAKDRDGEEVSPVYWVRYHEPPVVEPEEEVTPKEESIPEEEPEAPGEVEEAAPGEE